MSEPVPRLHVDISAELHKRAKLAAVERDETLKALIIEAVERLVDEHEAERNR